MVVACQMTVISLFFGAIEDVVGPHGLKMKNWICFTYGNFEKEIKLLAGKLNIPVYTL